MAYGLQELQLALEETMEDIENTKKENDDLLNDLECISKVGRLAIGRAISVNDINVASWSSRIKKIENFMREIEEGKRKKVEPIELIL